MLQHASDLSFLQTHNRTSSLSLPSLFFSHNVSIHLGEIVWAPTDHKPKSGTHICRNVHAVHFCFKTLSFTGDDSRYCRMLFMYVCVYSTFPLSSSVWIQCVFILYRMIPKMLTMSLFSVSIIYSKYSRIYIFEFSMSICFTAYFTNVISRSFFILTLFWS